MRRLLLLPALLVASFVAAWGRFSRHGGAGPDWHLEGTTASAPAPAQRQKRGILFLCL